MGVSKSLPHALHTWQWRSITPGGNAGRTAGATCAAVAAPRLSGWWSANIVVDLLRWGGRCLFVCILAQ
jgi:hypothetical protein